MVHNAVVLTLDCVVQIIQIDCAWKGQPPFAKEDFNYHHKLVGPTRTDIKPLNILQPEGPSFAVRPTPICLLDHPLTQLHSFSSGIVRTIPACPLGCNSSAAHMRCLALS